MTNKPVKKLDCDEIQPLLTDYLSRELGSARSAVVREHLRKCEACQAAVEDIDSTIHLLKATPSLNIPEKMSASSRRRMYRIYKHPILSWLDSNQTLITALALVALMSYLGAYLIIFSQPEPFNPDDHIIVNIGVWDGHNYTNEVPATNMPPPEINTRKSLHTTLWMVFSIIGGIVAVLLLSWFARRKSPDLESARKQQAGDDDSGPK